MCVYISNVHDTNKMEYAAILVAWLDFALNFDNETGPLFLLQQTMNLCAMLINQQDGILGNFRSLIEFCNKFYGNKNLVFYFDGSLLHWLLPWFKCWEMLRI